MGRGKRDDVPGLATDADTLNPVVDELRVVIPELLEANRLLNAIPRSNTAIAAENRAGGRSLRPNTRLGAGARDPPHTSIAPTTKMR
jgi:hypothetical protein